MKGKSSIVLPITAGRFGDNSRTYYGNTLTTLLGNPTPGKDLLRSLECTRLTSLSSKRTSQSSSARSNMTLSSFSFPSHTITPLWSSQESSSGSTITYTASRSTSRRQKSSSRRQRKTYTEIPSGIPSSSCPSVKVGDRQMGLTVWRLEREECAESLHVWSGGLSQKTDQEVTRVLAAMLDKSLGGASILTIEFQGHETSDFMRHFQDGIIIVEGKFKQRLNRAVKYKKRLYTVSGRRYLFATCIKCSADIATANSVLILDGYPRIYVWVGEQVDFVVRVKAIRLAKKIRTSQRNGRCHIIVIEQNDQEKSEAFLRKLPSRDQTNGSTHEAEGENKTNYQPHLYKSNGDRVMYDMPFVATLPLQHRYLTTMDSFILDMGPSHPLYIWIGSGTDSENLEDAVHCAESFIQYHGYPYTMPICRMMEGKEVKSFRKVFIDWKDRDLKGRQMVKTYHVSNIEKALFSKSNNHTVAKLTENESDEQFQFLMGGGTREVWEVNGEIQHCLPEEQHGEFNKYLCYITLYSENKPGEDQCFIYIWQGSKSNKETQDQVQKLAFSVDSMLGYKATIIRVVDGNEPQHFFTVFGKSIYVFEDYLIRDDGSSDSDQNMYQLTSCTENVNMFCVRELASECVRVSQVPPMTSFLNSSAAFVVISCNSTILWYGKNASVYEREYSKNVVAYLCPERAYDFDIITEGSNSAHFCSLMQQTGGYHKQFSESKLRGHSANLALCSSTLETWSFCDIPDFSQEADILQFQRQISLTCVLETWIYAHLGKLKHKSRCSGDVEARHCVNLGAGHDSYITQDLCETDSYILDTHDQILVWSGTSVVCRDYKLLSQAVQTYIELDPSGRSKNDIQIIFCNQGYEPSLFTRHFKNWDPNGYGGVLSFETARKQLRQENANIDIKSEMIDVTFMDTPKMSYRDLVKSDHLHSDRKEHYLSNKSFTKALQMTREQFYKLPKWKQCQILKSAGL